MKDSTQEKEICIYKDTKHVSFDDYKILTPNDSETYLLTVGVSNCSALILHFPESRILALAHILPSGSLQSFLARIKTDLEGKINEAPLFFMEDGPQGHLKYDLDNTFRFERRNPQDIMQYFPGATETKKVLRDAIKKDELYINLMAHKETGAIHVYASKYTHPKTNDFLI